MSSAGTSAEPTSPLAPVAPFPAEYRSRAPEFYGFVAWTSTSFLYVVYLLWALLPDEYIQWLGIYWYPSREWAILVPAYLVVICLLTYFVYFALALYGTPSFADTSAFIGSFNFRPLNILSDVMQIRVPTCRPSARAKRTPYLAYARPDKVPEIYDIPIGLVNRVAYGPHRKRPE
ncbi:PIG-P domain-containing protein [Mycena kentingensis (nom. inval.)]|nr:PIG-P domain-containing protein [Mycena kentingensis (nom. inval.)]